MSTLYIGTKMVRAFPRNRREYNDLRGWTLPSDENGNDAGYVVEYIDGGKPNHPDFEGYVSWSPKEQFDRAYREVTGVPFSVALEALKGGFAVAREGWNGAGMWVSLSPGSEDLPADKFWNKHNKEFAERNGGTATVLPYFTIKTKDGKIGSWVPSASDILAEDWVVMS